MEERELIDANAAARLTGLARSTLYKLVRQGRLRSFKVLGARRFASEDLKALVVEQPARARAPQSGRNHSDE